LAFAVQKVAELAMLAKALNDGRASVRHALDAASASVGSRRTSGKINDPTVKVRTEATDPSLARRSTGFEIRRKIQRRAADLGMRVKIGCHTFRATGITAYLEAGGTLENAQAMAAHESPRTTKVYDRTGDEITLDEIERITI
jgi:integrase